MDVRKEVSGHTGILWMKGALDIQSASQLKMVLLQAQDEVDDLILNLEQVTGVDVSGLQLLCAAHRKAWKGNRRLRPAKGIPPWFEQAARDAGFERSEGCPFGDDQTCFWRKG